MPSHNNYRILPPKPQWSQITGHLFSLTRRLSCTQQDILVSPYILLLIIYTIIILRYDWAISVQISELGASLSTQISQSKGDSFWIAWSTSLWKKHSGWHLHRLRFIVFKFQLLIIAPVCRICLSIITHRRQSCYTISPANYLDHVRITNYPNNAGTSQCLCIKVFSF